MADTLSSIYNSLNGGGYDQQRNVINQQLGAVDGQTQGVIAGLDAQKNTAFKGIDNQAASRGMFYSGAPIAEQQQYTGGTYLPALANVQTQAQNQKFGLQQALAGVNTAQTGAAQGIYQNQVSTDQQNNYYNQQLAQQKAYNDSMASMYKSTAPAAAQANPFNVSHDKSGGYAVTMNGKPATLAQYAAANGGGYQSVLQMLSQGSQGDRQLAQQLSKSSLSPQQLQQKYPQIFGGV